MVIRNIFIIFNACYLIDKIKFHFIEQNPVVLNTIPKKVIIPVALTFALFILTIFMVVIPFVEKNMMEVKREGIKHLTESAWSTLNLFYKKYQNKELSEDEAQKMAVSHFRRVRYGLEQEDYFWINDMAPNMIMHPYRTDLEGRDISGFQDSAGKKMFLEIVQTVKKNGSGYVDYLWQWKGNPEKIVPKISYVKEFKPWGWVIGTGIYVNDVELEIRNITRQMIQACSGIILLFLVLSGYIIWQGAKAEKERKKAIEQSGLREKQLIQADKMTSLGILVAGVAHEVNNPATTLMLNAPNLKKVWKEFTPIMDEHFSKRKDTLVCNMEYEQLSERIELMLDGIEDSATRIKAIITELKDFSRPAAAESEEEVDINDVIQRSLDLTHSITKKVTENLIFEPDENLPVILGNGQKLQQVMINLIVNASQALEDKKQSIYIKTSKDISAGFIVIEVSDTGPGVSPDRLKKLKDPFFTTKRDDGGTGLGLSISEKIIYDHNGMMEFSSEPGSGLTVKILLPFLTKKQETVPGQG